MLFTNLASFPPSSVPFFQPSLLLPYPPLIFPQSYCTTEYTCITGVYFKEIVSFFMLIILSANPLSGRLRKFGEDKSSYSFVNEKNLQAMLLSTIWLIFLLSNQGYNEYLVLDKMMTHVMKKCNQRILTKIASQNSLYTIN